MINPELPSGHRFVDTLGRFDGIDPLAEALARPARALRDRNPTVKDLLSGSWLGHSLHPILTDVPIGTFAALAVLDGVDLAGFAPVTEAADISLGFGIGSASAAALTGWADWADTANAPRRVGVWHALLNGTALGFYVLSFALRRAGRRRRAIAAAYAGLATLALAGYLGGELSTGMQLGVKHTGEPLLPPDEFTPVAAESDLVEGKPVRGNANGIAVVLVRDRGTIVALANACTHRGGPLHEGTVEDGCIRCPWHASRFHLRTGVVREGPATFDQMTFEVRVADGQVGVRRRAG